MATVHDAARNVYSTVDDASIIIVEEFKKATNNDNHAVYRNRAEREQDRMMGYFYYKARIVQAILVVLHGSEIWYYITVSKSLQLRIFHHHTQEPPPDGTYVCPLTPEVLLGVAGLWWL